MTYANIADLIIVQPMLQSPEISIYQNDQELV